jgi:hypothetical protein
MSIAFQYAHAVSILKHDIVIGDSFYKLGVLLGGPSLSLFDMLLAIGKGSRLNVPLVVCPFKWFVCLLGCESFHLVPCIPPFLGALVYF